MARLVPESGPDGNVTAEHWRWITAAVNALSERDADGGGYPAYRWFSALDDFLRHTSPVPNEEQKAVIAKLEALRRDALVAIAVDPSHTDAGRWLQLRHFSQDDRYGYAATPVAEAIGPEGAYRQGSVDVSGPALARPGIDPWLREMIAGRHEQRLGMLARGDGWANAVPAEGLAELHERAEAAYTHFKAAYGIASSRPEAAAGLLTLAVYGTTAPGEAITRRCCASAFRSPTAGGSTRSARHSSSRR